MTKIKSNELRIGNLIRLGFVMNGETIFTKKISCKGMHIQDLEKIEDGVEEEHLPYTDFAPQGITAEFVERMGFTLKGYDVKEDDIEYQEYSYSFGGREYCTFIIFNSGKTNFCLSSEMGRILIHEKIKYVHQLQNLMFSLTGKNLVIEFDNNEEAMRD